MFKLSISFAVCVLSVCVLADELVIVDIKPLSSTNAKFATIKDDRSLDKAIHLESSTYGVLESTVYRFNSLVRPHLNKIALRQAIEILKETKPKVEQLQKDLMLLKGITIEIQHNLKPKDFGFFIDKIALTKKDADHLLKHLNNLLEEFDCKFKRKCFDDDLKAAQNSLLQKITIMVDIEEECHEFTKECSERYKDLQEKFVEFQKEKISTLYTSFDTVCDGKCFPTPKQREQSSKDLLEFDTRVKGWVLTMKAKLKKLVEKELNHLNEHFLEDCKDLNNLKISAKSNSMDIPFLTGMVSQLGTSLVKTNKLHAEFVDVFDLLVFLEDVLTDDIFTGCFKRASTMYYLVNGFKIQINDCIAATKKDILIAQATGNVTVALLNFKNFKDAFAKESKFLGMLPNVVQSCHEVLKLEDSFTTFKTDLAKSKAALDFLKKRFHEADIKECEAIQLLEIRVDAALLELVALDLDNERLVCFLDIFDDVFCSH